MVMSPVRMEMRPVGMVEACRNGCEACRTVNVPSNGIEPEVKLSPDLEQTPRKDKIDKVR